MPTKWRRAYNTARRTLSDNGGPVLPDVPTPEQAMLILGNTAGGNRDIDQPTGDQRVPQGVRDEAMHGLRLSYKNDYAGWEFFGIARAIQLVLVLGVPMRTRERMKRYLEAHQKDKLAPHYGDEEKPSKGYMAMLNWGGDEGRAWNDDVKRATYSARTRGEAPMPTRRKNPIFYRRTTDDPTIQYSPIRPDRFAERVARQGESAYQHFGDDQPFWTQARLDQLLAYAPGLQTRRFERKLYARLRVEDVLEDMISDGKFPDLVPASTPVYVAMLSDAVPLYRVLGDTTPVSQYNSEEIQPIAIGLVTHAGKNAHAQGKALQLRPNTFDFGAGPAVPYWVEKHTVRPQWREVSVGDIVYTIPHGFEGDLRDYKPYRVTAVRTLRGSKLPPDVGVTNQQIDAISIEEPGVLNPITLLENDFLREDEMPPTGKWKRVTPAEADAASFRSSVRAARSTPAPARTMPSAEPPTRPTEALTAAAVAPPSAIAAKKRGKKPTDVIAVLADLGYRSSSAFVVLFDRAVLTRGELSEADVIGYATAYVQSGVARISVAAAEPGYAYLMYATLAKSIASESPGVTLVGSSSQTEYAKRFWARQPNGAIGNMPPSLFRRTFGVSYASFTSAGEELVQRLAKARSESQHASREALRSLGSNYFSDYYGVSSNASYTLGTAKLPRPAAPRETVEEINKLTARKLASSDLALVTVTKQSYGQTLATLYLLSVPKGKSTLTPANLLGVFDPANKYFTQGPYGPLAAQNHSPEAVKVTQALLEHGRPVETARSRREIAKWSARGEVLKDALAAAGMTDLDPLFAYLASTANLYGQRARRIASEQPTKLNPRRKKFEVTIVMPA
jgi:hypothetical protein